METEEKSSNSSVENEVDIVNKKNENEKLNRLLLINTFYYVLVFVVIGVPIWILTTSTYRASLPFDSIERLTLSLNKVEFKIKLEVIYFKTEIDELKLVQSKEFLQRELFKDLNQFNGIIINIDTKIRKSTIHEYELGFNSKKLEEFDEKISSNDANVLNVLVLDEKISNVYGISNEFVFLNNLFLNENNFNDMKNLANYIKNNYLHLNKLNENYRSKLDSARKLPNKKDLKVVNFDSEYEITFSLVNEKPELYSNWNIEFCIENYFQKIINQLSEYTSFSIKAQTLLYSDFGSYALSQAILLDNSSFYYLKPTDLSIMTNYIEGRLGSRISDSSALEFVTYIPLKQPLFISPNLQDPSDSKTNSFLVPRWGGIYIYNQMNSNTIQANDAMKTFLSQFLDLIGINLNKNSNNYSRSKIYTSEIFGYLLEKTLENQLNSINTLKSLSLLLTRINSMVIEDNIAEQIRTAVNSVEVSLDLAKEGMLKQAFHTSKIAFISSEKAFFDKSLLEKLYFPEDQRFAIYIPLFVPVGIPILLSIKSIITWFKSQKKDKNIKTD